MRRDCVGKAVYSRRRAHDKARGKTLLVGVPFSAYRCRACRGWHVGRLRRGKAVT